MKIDTIITLLIICVLSGCGARPPGNHALLIQAGAILDEDPNKAMQILYALDAAHKTSGNDEGSVVQQYLDNKSDSALFGLFYTTAIHQIGLEIRDVSLIANSVDYYRQQNDKLHLAKSLLQLGITNQSNKEWREAVTCLKQAEQMSERVGDDVFRYHIYDALGNLNEEAGCHELMLASHKKALAYATQLKNPSRMANSMNKLIRAYIFRGYLDSAKTYIQLAQPLLANVEDKVASDLLVSFGCDALEEKDTLKGKQFLLRALEKYPNDYGAKRLGDIMEAEGRITEAIDYWFESLNTNSVQVRIEAYEKLVQYYRSREEWRALDLSEHLNRLYQESRKNDKAETIAALQKEYDHEVLRHRFNRNLSWLIGLLSLLLIIIGSFYGYYRKKMNDYRLVLKRIDDLQNKLEEQKEVDTPADLSLMDTLLNDDTVHSFHRMADRGKMADDGAWTMLYNLVSEVLPDFLPAVNRNGLLSERDIRICMLIKLRFIPTEIATLIGESPQTITNSRARLLRKIFGEKGGAKDFDARIQELRE